MLSRVNVSPCHHHGQHIPHNHIISCLCCFCPYGVVGNAQNCRVKDFQVQGYRFASAFLLMRVFFSPIFIGFPCAFIMLSLAYEVYTAF